MELTAELLKQEARNHYGTEGYVLHGLMKNLFLTSGVCWLRERANCFWLIDAIASHQPEVKKDPMLREFQLWELKKDPEGEGEHSAILICSRDTDDPVITQKIPYTDFPLDDEGFNFYAEPGVAGVNGKETVLPVLMLPSER